MAVSRYHAWLSHPSAAFWHPNPSSISSIQHSYPEINMHTTTNPPLPTFHTDPALPFAPWRPSLLPRFRLEHANRVLLVPDAQYLAALGSLYPHAEFVVARCPASQTFTARTTGRGLVRGVALHFPSAMVSGPQGAQQQQQRLDHGAERMAEAEYIVSLRRREWPTGGVAWLPRTEQAREWIDELRGAFDLLPNGQEAFYSVPHTVVPRSPPGNGDGGTEKGMRVCRAYEGLQGPQDARLIVDWIKENGSGGVAVEEDALGKEVLARMGEAWVHPDRYPKPTKAERAARERAANRAREEETDEE
ncbi:hypothetical protein C8A01DRAFT_40021 [Parachaetomium inaequale]|uniref:Uncharacterized protein n=1 Tax=Parachaetomium inaequale TaxID=2588326 RepID=A0AAN6PBV4_9PEZI|nr:hypothetical protein C8A01DRAFT_40021 [Parachaetomium inaequale]